MNIKMNLIDQQNMFTPKACSQSQTTFFPQSPTNCLNHRTMQTFKSQYLDEMLPLQSVNGDQSIKKKLFTNIKTQQTQNYPMTRPQQLEIFKQLTRWYICYYREYHKNSIQIKDTKDKIRTIQRANEKRKRQIFELNGSIIKDKQILKQLHTREQQNSNKQLSALKNYKIKTQARIDDLQTEISQLDSIYKMRTMKKYKKYKQTNYLAEPNMFPNFFNYNPFAPQYYHQPPNIISSKKSGCDSNFPISRKPTGKFADIYQGLQQSQEESYDNFMGSSRKNSAKRALPTQNKSSKMKIQWPNDGDEREMVEELDKKKQIIKKPEQSRVNILVEESAATQISKRKKPKNLIRQSIVKIDINEDSSNSKSQEISIQEPNVKTRKKSNSFHFTTIENYEQNKPITASQYKQPTLTKRPPHKGIKIVRKKQKSKYDINDVVIDAKNLKESQFPVDVQFNSLQLLSKESLVEETPNSLVSFKDEHKNEKIEEDDDEYFNSMKLNAVSKISKQKTISYSESNQMSGRKQENKGLIETEYRNNKQQKKNDIRR